MIMSVKSSTRNPAKSKPRKELTQKSGVLISEQKNALMKIMKTSAILAACGLLALGANTLQAQVTTNGANTVTFNLTVRAQDLDNVQVGSSPIYKSTFITRKVTNKDILKMLEMAYSTTFPSGSLLTIDWYSGDFIVLDKHRNLITNTTSDGFFNKYYDSETNDVLKETSNHDNNNYSSSIFETAEIRFDDAAHTNSFTLSGLETYSYSANGHTGIGTESLTLTGVGTGALNAPVGDGTNTAPFFLVNGTFSSRGKGAD